jgi:hypothetical protein
LLEGVISHLVALKEGRVVCDEAVESLQSRFVHLSVNTDSDEARQYVDDGFVAPVATYPFRSAVIAPNAAIRPLEYRAELSGWRTEKRTASLGEIVRYLFPESPRRLESSQIEEQPEPIGIQNARRPRAKRERKNSPIRPPRYLFTNNSSPWNYLWQMLGKALSLNPRRFFSCLHWTSARFFVRRFRQRGLMLNLARWVYLGVVFLIAATSLMFLAWRVEGSLGVASGFFQYFLGLAMWPYFQFIMSPRLFSPNPSIDPRLEKTAKEVPSTLLKKRCSPYIPASFYGLMWIVMMIAMYVCFILGRQFKGLGFVGTTLIPVFYLIFGWINVFVIRAEFARQAKLTETADVR